MKNQEWIALVIVAGAVLAILYSFYRGYIAPPLARWLLRSGHVKWAMRIRGQTKSVGPCSNCDDD